MTRLEVFESERHERALYVDIMPADIIETPVTRDGLEALIEEVAAHANIPIDDELRQMVCGFIHSLDRKTSKFPLQDLISAAHKSYSNQLTWIVLKELEEKFKEKQKTQETGPELTVVESHEVEANH